MMNAGRRGARVLLTLVLLTSCKKESATEPEIEAAPVPPRLHAEGRWLVDGNGTRTTLRGVNIPSLEWTAGGDNMLRSLEWTIDQWGANCARIPLSQDRWFGHASEQSDDGAGYRALVDALVDLASRKKSYIWLDLHWNNAGVWGQNIGQHKMPDQNSALFWAGLAERYKNHPAVLFGLYNEPHNVSWEIWKNGGTVTEDGPPRLEYEAAGHQELVDLIRAAGADNAVIAAGLDWGFDLSGILKGYDLEGDNIVYDTHPYPWKSRDWDRYFGAVGELYPLFVGEWGGTLEEGHQQYGVDLAAYIRRKAFHWTAWCFHPSAGPQLIQNWDYDPTWFGQLVMRELERPVELE